MNGLSSGLAALFIVFVCAAVPLLLLAAASLMAWGYRRTLSGPTGRDLPDLEPAPSGHLVEGPRLSSMGEASPVEVSLAAEQILEEARSLVLFIVVLHTLLLRARAQRPKLALRRLLLPRVFGGADERADLLDALDDTWRRIGAIDLLVANDVASRTLGASMLEAFLRAGT